MDNRAINMASVIAADSFYSGANWGFLLEENAEFESILSILNNSNVKKIRVDNGYIVFCDYEYLKNVIARVEPLTEEVLVRYRTRLQREIPELQKLLTSVLRKNCKYLDDCGSYYELNIGLYCTNNMNKMRINGIEYPAFFQNSRHRGVQDDKQKADTCSNHCRNARANAIFSGIFHSHFVIWSTTQFK